MTEFQHIEQKLHTFITKYYKNELIKGLILFISFGLLYVFFTLFIEYFLWLKPTARTILFWSFITIELFLFIKFIGFPLLKILGFKKELTQEDASKIIGKYFTEVDDKLLNVIQLNKNFDNSELLIASINQKSKELEPIPFKHAINFYKNKKYLKYLAIPLFIWFIIFISGYNFIFKSSLERVVNYDKTYEPPAPFKFTIPTDLSVLEGEDLTVNIITEGKLFPENVKIHYGDNNHFLREIKLGNFQYTFSNLDSDLDFYLSANGISSNNYHIKVIKVPNITNFKMYFNYPKYTSKSSTLIKNTGNATVPEGTKVSWKIVSNNTSSIHLQSTDTIKFSKINKTFTASKILHNSIDYTISTSNKELKNYENLAYSIQVIKDEFPKILIKTDIDSISRGEAHFVGQLSDDYGLQKLVLTYYDKNKSTVKKNFNLPINHTTFEEFYYVFPKKIDLEQGVNYEFYFELFDNDNLHGNKSIKSRVFSYRNKTDQELTELILKEQKQSLEDFKNISKKKEKINKALEDFSKKMKSKSEMDWQDKKEFKQFIKRQKQYQDMFKKNTKKLENNINELKEENPKFKEQKEDLKKRLQELKEMQKKEKLLEELKKLAEKLDKEKFLEKLDKLTQKNKQNEKSLERILELTKRFYVQKKAEEIANKIKNLAKKQDELAKSKENTAEKQKALNKEFDQIKKEMSDLQKQNKVLKKPMDIPKKTEEQESVTDDMKSATEKLEENQDSDTEEQQKQSKESAAKKQKSAAKKMQKMSGDMQQSMMGGGGEMLEEDIDNLRSIVENLIRFSLKQEDLMNNFTTITVAHPQYAKKLKFQQVLKEHFEHIDDSIYSLSLRNPKISEKLNNDIIEVHYNLNQSLKNISENKIRQGLLNQQTTMMAANNLANYLSDVLDAAQSPSMGEGKGKGSSSGKSKGKGEGQGFQLSDIIKKQSEMLKKAKEKKEGQGKGEKKGNKGKQGKQGKGKKDGQGKGKGQGKGSEQMDGEMYEIYKQQNSLKEAFRNLINKSGKKGNIGNKALKQMEDLENELLDKGLTQSILQRMENIKHELLKLDKAAFEQGEDKKRKSNTNTTDFNTKHIKEIDYKKIFFNSNEILNRQSLPLKTIYRKRVQNYFSLDTIN